MTYGGWLTLRTPGVTVLVKYAVVAVLGVVAAAAEDACAAAKELAWAASVAFVKLKPYRDLELASRYPYVA